LATENITGRGRSPKKNLLHYYCTEKINGASETDVSDFITDKSLSISLFDGIPGREVAEVVLFDPTPARRCRMDI
jgi:hypothetical protein